MSYCASSSSTAAAVFGLLPSPRPTRILPPLSIPRSSFSVRKLVVSCEVAVRSSNESAKSDPQQQEQQHRIGARVRVKVPLKVYHVPKVPEVDLTGKEGKVKQYVGVWKDKQISANLPYKVEFLLDIEGRDAPVKLLAHLREDEFEYLD
ncbi:Ferredoxin-thioredoxin reductase, variable chain [Linum perenne]